MSRRFSSTTNPKGLLLPPKGTMRGGGLSLHPLVFW